MLSRRLLYHCGTEGGTVAGRVQLTGDVIRWFAAGGRERAYVVATTLPAARGVAFAFVDHKGRTFMLRPLSLRLYNTTVRQPGQPWIRTRRQLHAAYRRSLRG